PQQALVDQRLQGVELGGTDRLRRLELEASGKYGRPCKQQLLAGGEEPIAPLDRPAQRALPLGCVLCTGRQQVETRAEALEDLFPCQHLHARGCELEREREPVEPLSDLTHCSIGLKAGLELSCALREERRCLVEWERRRRKLLFGRDIEAASARGEDARIESGDNGCHVRDQLFEVVEYEQR